MTFWMMGRDVADCIRTGRRIFPSGKRGELGSRISIPAIFTGRANDAVVHGQHQPLWKRCDLNPVIF